MTEPRQITKAAFTANAADKGYLWSIRPEYSSVCPWSANGDYLLLVTNSGYYELHDGNGPYLCDLPFDITMGAQPRWSRKIPSLLYYLFGGNQLRSYDLNSRESAPVRTFPEYTDVTGKGESDIVGDSMVLIGDSREVFTLNLKTGAKGPVLDVKGQAVESLYLSTDGEVLVSSPAGIELYDGSIWRQSPTLRLKISASNPHKCMTRDTNGDAVLVWCGSDDGPLDCNGIVKTRLADGTQTVLYRLSWHLAMHFAPTDNAGFVFVSTYHDPTSELTKKYAPSEFDDAILRAPLDGSGITKLADSGSSAGIDYDRDQPRATCSRDGSKICWGSNQGGATVDTFLMTLAENSPRTRKPHKPGEKRRPHAN